MTRFLDHLLRLWTEPLPEGDAAVAEFRQLYADPVLVNGANLSAASLVERARSQQRAFEGLQIEVIDQVEVPGKLVVVFRQRGRHVGPLPTPLGAVAPTGKIVERQIIDVLTITHGRVAEIQVVADDLGLLTRLGAVRLI